METFDQADGFSLDLASMNELSPEIIPISLAHLRLNDDAKKSSLQPNDLYCKPIFREYFLSNISFRGPPAFV